MHAPLETALEMLPPTEYGPAMAALRTERQRRFVVAMFDVPQNRRARINAARLAGYGRPARINPSPLLPPGLPMTRLSNWRLKRRAGAASARSPRSRTTR
jgi:hypothetical protein